MTSLQNQLNSVSDFSDLGLQRTLVVRLNASYIALGRKISNTQMVVDILDQSQMADHLRAQEYIDFEIEGDIRLVGRALVSVGASRIGQFNRRFLEVTLHLQDASLMTQQTRPLQWLT